MSDLPRQLPAVHAVLADPRVAGLPRAAATVVAREVLDGLRRDLLEGLLDVVPDVAGVVRTAVDALLRGSVRPVINATGIVVHTNLGRAPWAPEAIAAAARAAGYASVEIDLGTGERGARAPGVTALLRHLTGAEDALVVNNGAAAVLLAVTALARGREVVVSRGELVEIGGSFRVPDVIASGGARLVEVGTTNRTRAADYGAAIGPATAVLLRVHPSNFRIVGFTEAPERAALVALARSSGLAVVEDLGSGSLDGDDGEPSIREAIGEGVDVALFSGDKLLGGPQAGVAVGRAGPIAAMRAHPLYRALRVDKVTLAALEATLALRASGRATPVDTMLGEGLPALAARAATLAADLVARGVPAEIVDDVGYTGGGAHAACERPTKVVTVRISGVGAVVRALRTGDPAIVPRVADGALVLDVRTLRDDELSTVAERVATALARR